MAVDKAAAAEEELPSRRISWPMAGIPVDAGGGPTIDPTKNVLDLVRAESKYQDAMRDQLERRLVESVESLKEFYKETTNNIREFLKLNTDSTVSFQNAMREAETKRIDQIASTRQEFLNTIRDMMAESVRTTSNLVSTQLVQIQATFDTRVTKLEAGAFTQAGKSSVAEPAIDDALRRMRTSQEESMARMNDAISAIQSTENRSGGREMGRSDTNARILAVVMAVAAVASPVIAILAVRGH